MCMKNILFDHLLQSLKEAKAISNGEVKADAVSIIVHTKAPDADVTAVRARRRKVIAPVLDYLKDR